MRTGSWNQACSLALSLAVCAVLAGTPLFVTSAVAQSAADLPVGARDSGPQSLHKDADELLVLANSARAAAGLGALRGDPALAAAALQHCLRMAREGSISHRFAGEPELTDRAGEAGAHFSTIEENIAAGSYPTDPAEFQDGWMHSPGHRANLLSHEVDSVGIAVVASHGVTYVVADYSRAVPYLSQTQIEAAFAKMLRARGVSIRKNNRDARTYCALPEGGRSPRLDGEPQYRMRWQNADVTAPPQELLDRIAAQGYREAAVGSCPAQNTGGEFTVYRVAVLLYSPAPNQQTRRTY